MGNDQVPQDWTIASRRQAIIQKEGNSYRIFDGDRAKKRGNGIFLNQTRINFTEGHLLKSGEQLYIGQDPQYQISLTYYNPKSGTMSMPSLRRLNLKGLQDEPVELGRTPNPDHRASIQLDAPTVSRLHATIYSDGKGGHILQDRSTNGTFVNGNRLEKRQLLQRGDTIQIGPYILLYTGDALELKNATDRVRIDAHQLVRKVKDKRGKEKLFSTMSL